MFILVAIPIFVVVASIWIYNSLIRKRNQIDNIIGTMDAMLKKRWDLVPNLVWAVKGYAGHEREVFEQVARIRSLNRPQLTTEQKVGIDNLVTELLIGIRGVVERYPDLKASENFMHLQRTLTELEEQISAARRAFNAMVTDYNNTVQSFPSSIIARAFGFGPRELFHIERAEKGVPPVNMVRIDEDTARG